MLAFDHNTALDIQKIYFTNLELSVTLLLSVITHHIICSHNLLKLIIYCNLYINMNII